MKRSLRSLEQSLNRRRQSAQAFGLQKNRAEGTQTPVNLQEQIAVVRGQRVGVPTTSLRALESRVLGRPTAAEKNYPQQQTLRIDQGQLNPASWPASPHQGFHKTSSPNPYSPPHYVAPHSAALNYVAPNYAAANSAFSHGFASARTDASAAYSPEFSAPDTGRFHVESFNEPAWEPSPLNPALRLSASAPAGNAVHADRFPAPVPHTSSPAPELADDDWLAAARADQPQQITKASKESLNPGLALAKADFERDLASILGNAGDKPTAVEPPFDPSRAQQPQAPSATPASAEPEVMHPDHSVFDQMGLAMRYANSFDLGQVSLNDRFDRFDQELDKKRGGAQKTSSSLSSPFVDPMNLDDFDLVAELAEIGIERPEPTASCECEPKPTAEHQPSSGERDTSASPTEKVLSRPDQAASPNPPIRMENTAGEDNEQPTN